MKKIVTLVMVALVATSALTGCKKGANDPFLSLKSRKARLKGDWKLVKEDKTVTNSNGTTTYTYDGSIMTVKDNSGNVSTYTYEETYTFDKKGTVSGMQKITYNDGDYEVDKMEAQWAFVGKNKDADLKNKEAIIFSGTKYTNEYKYGSLTGTSTDTEAGDFGSRIADSWVLDKLSSKEMVVIVDYTYTDSNNNTYTEKATLTFEKQ